MRGSMKGYGFLVLFVVTGAVLGGMLGEVIKDIDIFSGVAPYLVKTYSIIDMSPTVVNLYVIKLSIGFIFEPNLISIFGVLAAIFLFKRF